MAKLSAEQMKVVDETQELVCNSIVGGSRPADREEEKLLLTLSQHGEDRVVQCLGEVGRNLKRFADQVDLGHPDLYKFVNSLQIWPDLSDKVFKAFSSGKAKLEAGQTPTEERESINAIDPFRRLSRNLSRPKPRLLKDKSRREQSRKVKKFIKPIGLKHNYINGENCFYTKPVSPKFYACGSREWDQELELLAKKGQAFEARGMKEVAGAFAKRVAQTKELMEDTFNGFYRLKPDDAALAIARFHEFRWNDHQGLIIVPFQFFEDNPFWQDEKEVADETKKYEDIDEMRRMEEVKRWVVFKEKKLNIVDTIGFHFQPRLYPLQKLAEEMSFTKNLPARVEKVISAVESHPSVGGGSLFDYYWVVVPSVNVSHPLIHRKSDGNWVIRKNRSLDFFTDGTEAAISLDRRLIEDKVVMPIVLGERDGKCYFLCLWSD